MKDGAISKNYKSKIASLFHDDKDEASKTRKIKSFLKKHKEYYQHRFILDRTVLHMAVLKQLPELVEHILEEMPALIEISDRNNNSVFHYGVNHYDERVFNVLIQYGRRFINLPNKDGNTALHEGLLINNREAIAQLFRAKANIYLPNNKGITAYQLVVNGQLLDLFHTSTAQEDLAKVIEVFPPLIHRKKVENEVGGLIQIFSEMRIVETHTSRNVTASRSTSLSSSDLMKGKPLDNSDLFEIIRSANLELLSEYLTQGGNPEQQIFLGRTLLIQAIVTAASPPEDKKIDECNRYNQQVILLLNYAKLNGKDKHNRDILDFIEDPSDRKILVLRKVYQKICQDLMALISGLHEQLELLDFALDRHLYDAGFQVVDHQSIEWREDDPIWNLCSAFHPETKERCFNKTFVCDALQGLLSDLDPHSILQALRKLWPQFNPSQKFIGIFIVKELLIWDIHQQIIMNDILQLKLLFRLISQEFPLHINKIMTILNEIIVIKRGIATNVLYQNYRILSEWLQLPLVNNNLPSFDHLLSETVTLPQEVQVEKIQLIARQIQSTMIGFFQNVDIKEFYHGGWLKENKMKTSPHLVKQANEADIFAAYIGAFILRGKTPHECAARIGLIIRVAEELNAVQNGIGPNFCSIFFILSALESRAISRMKTCFELLSKEEKSAFLRLKEMVDAPHCQKLRLAYHAFPAPLFFIGQMLGDLERSSENKGPVKYLIWGKIYREILHLQRELISHVCYFETDICALQLKEDETIENFYFLSGRFAPVVLDFFTLSEIETFIKFMIEQDFLAKVKLGNKDYEADSIYCPILMKLSQCLYSNDDLNSEKEKEKEKVKEEEEEKQNEEKKLKILQFRKLAMDFKAFVEKKCPGTSINIVNILTLLPEIKDDKKQKANKKSSEPEQSNVLLLSQSKSSRNSTEDPQRSPEVTLGSSSIPFLKGTKQ